MSERRLAEQIKRIVNLTDHIDVENSIESIKKSIEFSGPNVWILFFAIVIASVGLNVNSIPVIIGAMLVSPLMGPITGVGLALGINDSVLLRKSLKNLGIMVLISLIASSAYFLLTPLNLDTPTELLARTNPTIYDVFIALFGGLAGIVEVCRKEKGTVISGVAIATALMPPLCTAGYGIANGNGLYFLGAIYLFFINSVFIALASYIIVRYLQFPYVRFADPAKQKKVRKRISLFTLILIIPSIYSAIIMISENRFNQNAKRFINENKTMERCYIYDYSINHHKKPSQLILSIAGDKLSDKDAARLYSEIEKYGISKEQLVIEQNAAMLNMENTTDKDMVNELFKRTDNEIKSKEETIRKLQKEIDEYRSYQIPYDQISEEIKAQHPEIKSIIIGRGMEKSFAPAQSAQEKTVQEKNSETDGEKIICIVRTSKKMTQETAEKLKDWLSVRLDHKAIRIIQEIETEKK